MSLEKKIEENFEKIYEELYKENNQILKDAKSTRNKNVIKLIIIFVLINCSIAIFDKSKTLLFVSISVSFLIILFIFHKENVKYIKLFKDNIINEIVKKCNEKLSYTPESGLTKFDYSISGFDRYFDELSSEDKIHGKLGNDTFFQMSQLTTTKINKRRNEKGEIKTERIETFRGIYGIVKLEKSTDAKVYIANNSLTKKFSAKRIEMDSLEFEQEYDCLTEDKITALKIFTSDILEIFIDLKKAKLNAFELKLEDNTIYFRSRCGEIFEPPNFKNALQKDIIRKYYNIIYLPFLLVEKIIENINVL